MLLDFEVKHKEEVERPQGLTIGIPVPVMPDEIPVESGSVLRQKNEIEMKYGSSPRHSKLSPDNSLCPPSVPPSDGARLTPTLEKYCANDILSLTEEVPEGFLDEDGDEYDLLKQLRVDSSEPSHFTDQQQSENHLKQQKIPSDAGSQFQRSFSYRENCQQKQSKTLPFLGRSASLRLRWLSNAAKSDSSVVGSSPGITSKTSASSVASFSSTEVCRRLLKEKNQQNEHASAAKLCDTSNEDKHSKPADVAADKDKPFPLPGVLNTVQLPAEVSANLTVSNQTESCSRAGDSDCKYDLHQVNNEGSMTNVTKSFAVPVSVVIQDVQTIPASAFVSKVAPQQSMSHSSSTTQSVEQPTPSACATDKDRGPSVTGTGYSEKQAVARNTVVKDVGPHVMSDTIQVSNLKVFNGRQVVNKSQSQSAEQPMQVDASNVTKSSVQSVQPLASDGLDVTSNSTQFVADQQQVDDGEQYHIPPLKKRYSFNEKYSSFISNEPDGKLYRSQSVRAKSSTFLRHTAASSELVEAQKVKKPYGKSHPLSKLSGKYLSRDCGRTIKDFACDHDAT